MALRWDRGGPDVPLLVDLGDTGLANEEIAWLSRDIAAVAGSETPRSRLAQHVMQAPTGTSVGTIEAARERISRSEATARHVGAILIERPALETDP